MRRILIALSVTAAACTAATSAATLAQDYDQPGAFAAVDVLPADQLSGAHHQVAPIVANDGIANHYVIRSEFGEFSVSGNDQLAMRVFELGAIAQLRATTRTQAALGAARERSIALIRSPFQLIRASAGLIADPGGVAQVVQAVPAGVGRVADTAGRVVREGAEAASGAIGSAVEGEACDPDADACADIAADTAAFANDVARRYSGHEKEVSRLQRELGVDPHSDNDVLHRELDRVAGARTAAGIGFRFVPNPYGAVVGAMSSGVGLYEDAERLALYEDPELRRQREAAEIAEWGGVSPETVIQFQTNSAYSPTTQTLLLADLRRIEDVAARRTLFAIAAAVETSADARRVMRVTGYLADLQTADDPAVELVVGGEAPNATTASGLLIVPVVADYFLWTAPVEAAFERLRAVAEARGARRAELHLSGTASPRFLSEAAARDVVVRSYSGF